MGRGWGCGEKGIIVLYRYCISGGGSVGADAVDWYRHENGFEYGA